MIDLGLEGKRALVTGAGVGIGQGIASWLAAAGCDVMLVDRDDAWLAEGVAAATAATAESGAEPGGRVASAALDLRAEGGPAAAVAATVDALGGLDIAVNNVGSMAGRKPADFVDCDEAYLRDIVEQNLMVTMMGCHAQATEMVRAGTAGVIVNVSSGETTRPSLRMASYGAAKAAINHLTSTLAVELAPHGIRVVSVAPGTTLSPVVREALTDEQVDLLLAAHPLGRLGEPEDLGRLVVALVSDLGRAVTGTLVFGDNGAQLARNRPQL